MLSKVLDTVGILRYYPSGGEGTDRNPKRGHEVSVMRIVKFETSWADTTAKAEREHGDIGRRMALLLRAATSSGSKGVMASLIEAAGFQPLDATKWAGQPWSAAGLAATAQALYDWLATVESA